MSMHTYMCTMRNKAAKSLSTKYTLSTKREIVTYGDRITTGRYHSNQVMK